MKYRIHTFKKGWYKKTNIVEGKTHKDALRKTLTTGAYPSDYYHFVVVGKTTRRYNNKIQLIKGPISIHKFSRNNYVREYFVLLMIGNVSEAYETTKSEREKLCTALESAKTANPDAPLNAITACLEETGALPSGSIHEKTSKKFVTTAISQDDLTHMLTVETFGSASVKGTGNPTWKSGSKASPSKQGKILATVNVKGKENKWPSINPQMRKMDGKKIEVSHTGEYWYGAGWQWLDEWLIFEEDEPQFATVVQKTPVSVASGGHTDTMNDDMLQHLGKTLLFTKSEWEGWWKHDGYTWHESWLDFDNVSLYALKGKSGAVSFVTEMNRFVGKKIDLKLQWNTALRTYVYVDRHGWHWLKEWLSVERPESWKITKTPMLKINPIIYTGGA